MNPTRFHPVRCWAAASLAVLLGTATLGAADPFQFWFSFFLAEIPEAAPGITQAVVVADTGGDGFNGVGDKASGSSLFASTLISGGLLDGDNDLVLAVITAQEMDNLQHNAVAGAPESEILGAPPGPVIGIEQNPLLFDTSSAPWSSLQPGQQVGVFWFIDGSTGPGSPYGFYRSDSVGGDGGDAAFIVPGPGAVANIVVLSDSVAFEESGSTVEGTTPLASITANNAVVIPEPGALPLLLLSTTPLLLLHRKRRRSPSSVTCRWPR
ncbi:MAG TPA: PEP-CTERM sorting domain-containing protein [Verrucomicrobiales bacterium]|nr:PEP-CTERM sorting domain-containing protein [Verrucomicrobiales bacterium]